MERFFSRLLLVVGVLLVASTIGTVVAMGMGTSIYLLGICFMTSVALAGSLIGIAAYTW